MESAARSPLKYYTDCPVRQKALLFIQARLEVVKMPNTLFSLKPLTIFSLVRSMCVYLCQTQSVSIISIILYFSYTLSHTFSLQVFPGQQFDVMTQHQQSSIMMEMSVSLMHTCPHTRWVNG